ncbi:hypothetical protein PCIT_b0595 [Pseudoalteromonas citrea]|uniref:Cell division protein ZapE n=2 Tax=Pseudoalteromonas citrea TaxID=43655 RepID=A0AAD4AEN7_9GAMM|nr:cell division protein ZapE [Pseudoalteromonas citrea]KAF7764559.1 hypothetical protein PCIT_b0595 [Pseudoalteromonas citrea]
MHKHYLNLIQSGELNSDDAQLNALNYLANLQQDLYSGNPTKGAYLHGPVGRGKSMLMDLFFDTLTNIPKQRVHFHHFMALVHQSLNDIQGTHEPLQVIAKSWAKKTKVLCFDEFFVSDIGDAMIMAGLFEALFDSGVVLIATSNCQPDTLYKNGLQRDRFLPTIKLIHCHCEVIGIYGPTDHRFSQGFNPCYISVGDEPLFDCMLHDLITSPLNNSGSFKTITICNREIATLGFINNAIAFDFVPICSAPRATADYIELAQRFAILMIKNVPQMGSNAIDSITVQGVEDGYKREKSAVAAHQLDDEARRFIALVDEYYDQGCLIILHCEVALQSLYVGKQLAFEFERTKSRLVEMQNWSLNHLRKKCRAVTG